MSYQRFRPTSQNRMPPGLLNLIILNVILFITNQLYNNSDTGFQLTGYSAFANNLSLHHPFSPDFHFYQYLTSMFMHANFQHLLFNMLGLWIFGAMVENAYGTKRFLILYLVCGVGASLIYQLVMPLGGQLLGASGAVYGVLLAAAMLFPNTEMYMMFIPVPVKLKWLAIFYGLTELYSSWRVTPGDNTAHLAHLGGMIFGFILVKIYSRNKTHFY
jgi:membrane associated rhomboid family serine protease